MELISNFSFIEAAAKQLTGAKPCPYSNLDLWKQVSTYGYLKCETIDVNCEQSSNQFQAFFISHKHRPIQPCIIYLHGLSSYSLEGQYLMQYIQDKFCLCIYDLRGHGKNKIPQVTYGLNEATDLYSLIKKLRQRGIQDVYLWGRSMGASTILNFLNLHGNDQLVRDVVKYAVLDSAFNSFQQIAKQTVAKNLGVPAFVCSPLVNVTLNKIIQKDKIDLRVLNFSNMEKVKYSAVFIYSQRDAIVDYNHSRQIIQRYGGLHHIIVGNFQHNDPRSFDIVKKAMSYFGISKYHSTKNLFSPKSVTPKKGLSISLISNNNINLPSHKQFNADKQNSNPLSPKMYIRSVSPYSPTSPLSAYKQQGIAFSIKRDLVREDRAKVKTSQQVIEQRSKSKPKSKHRIPTLTNRRYI